MKENLHGRVSRVAEEGGSAFSALSGCSRGYAALILFCCECLMLYRILRHNLRSKHTDTIDLIAILPRIRTFQDIQQISFCDMYSVYSMYSVTSALARIPSAPDLVDAIAQTAWRGQEPCPHSLTLVADTALRALSMKLRYDLLALRLGLREAVSGFLYPSLQLTGRKQRAVRGTLCLWCRVW